MTSSQESLQLIQDSFNSARSALDQFLKEKKNLELVNQFALQASSVLKDGKKIITCGNGGSMCDAMHFAEELTGQFRAYRKSLPAIAISDPSHMTCSANDFGFDKVFSRYVEGLGQEGDLLLGISTSGNSPNVINAVEEAKKKKMFTVALLGKDGGKLKDMVDIPIIVPHATTSDRIQEIHIKIIHITIEAIEAILGLS